MRAPFDCGCPACRQGLTPFTVAHFRAWALELVLDSGEFWVVEDFFAAYLEDYFAGIPECWLIVPEGNTKTTGLAGLVLYLLEHRVTASVPWGASSREQAEIGYRQAEGFVFRSQRLRSVFKCQEGYRRIKHLSNGGRMQVFAADDAHADGIIPTDAFLDELHRHKNLRLYRTWRGKLLKRGGQIGTISTAGEPGAEFEETRERIRQSTPIVERRDGFLHCRSVGLALHEWAVAEDGDVEDMAVVKAANPFTGITVAALEAKRSSPTMTLEHWRRFVCNLPTRSGLAAISEAEWFGAETDERIPAGVPIDLGLDVGWKWDTTALVPLWGADGFHLLGDATVLEPPRDGSSLDPMKVERALIVLHERNPIATVVMDMSRAEQLASWIESELGATVIDRTQGNKQAGEDYARFTEALRLRTIRHTGCPLLKRHALNAVARVMPLGDAKFDRPSQTRQGGDQDRRVIDALIAAAMVFTVVTTLVVEAEPFAEVW